MRLKDHACFYKEIYNLMEQVGIDGNNAPYLYFIMTRCVKNQSYQGKILAKTELKQG